MEKKSHTPALKQSNIKRIVITGPESTGKTTLCEFLAGYYHTEFIPEYAREYVENLNRPYDYSDVEKIARKQLELEQEFLYRPNKILFYDTFLVVTRVWFEVVYKQVPSWFKNALLTHKPHHFLLMNTDLPWVPDPVRENGGEMRQQLFKRYQEIIREIGCTYTIITGSDDSRRGNAVKAVERILDESSVS